ncbi:MAG: hypothetical protein NZM26_03070, partial [Patescibacteria group bacterium]|nr:hypothetical protein [Patescibacteria group bacterium]
MEIETINHNQRSEFSDFLLIAIESYFKALNYPPRLKRKIIAQEVILLPIGSINRGNADASVSDIDIVFITKTDSHGELPTLGNGQFHPRQLDLAEFVLEMLKQSNPDLAKIRTEIPYDNPVFTQKQILKAISNQNLNRE